MDYAMREEEAGYSGFYDERDNLTDDDDSSTQGMQGVFRTNATSRSALARMGIGALGAMGYAYNPDLSDVGHGDSYFPGSVAADAHALEYLGYAIDGFVDSTGTQAGDMAESVGAWDPMFRSAVQGFQNASGLEADGWIGPTTRSAIAVAILAKDGGPPPPPPSPDNQDHGGDDFHKGDLPVPPNRQSTTPVSLTSTLFTKKNLVIGGVAVGLLALGYALTK